MEIRGEKELEYINKLLFQFEQHGTLQKAWNKIRGKDQRYTETELKEFLNYGTSDHAGKFLDKLKEEDALIHAGGRKTASKPVDTWKLDRAKLLDAYINSDYFQEYKELNASALDHSGEAWKIN